jgi:hypothetical protein
MVDLHDLSIVLPFLIYPCINPTLGMKHSDFAYGASWQLPGCTK